MGAQRVLYCGDMSSLGVCGESEISGERSRNPCLHSSDSIRHYRAQVNYVLALSCIISGTLNKIDEMSLISYIFSERGNKLFPHASWFYDELVVTLIGIPVSAQVPYIPQGRVVPLSTSKAPPLVSRIMVSAAGLISQWGILTEWLSSLLTIMGLSALFDSIFSNSYLQESAKLLVLGSVIETGRRLCQWVIERFRYREHLVSITM